MNSQNATLGDFVQQLLLQMKDNELHFKQERPWHELFYRLKTGPDAPGKPGFLRDLFFEWNGDYPKCPALSEYLHALHWTGCMTAANPGYDRFRLNEEIGTLWATDVEGPLMEFLNQAAEDARHQLTV